MPQLLNTSLITDPNLVGYWLLDGNSNDFKGANNGTDTSITYSNANGKFNSQGAGFNGSTSKIVLTDTTLKPTGSFTISAWFKMSSDTSFYDIFSSYSQNTAVAGIFLGVNDIGDAAHKMQFVSGKNTGTGEGTDWAGVRGATTVDDGAWHHVAAAWGTTTLLLYIDGVLDAAPTSWSNAPAYAAGNGASIGFRSGSGATSHPWPGVIDDVAFFSRRLTQSEVSLLANTTGLPNNYQSFKVGNGMVTGERIR